MAYHNKKTLSDSDKKDIVYMYQNGLKNVNKIGRIFRCSPQKVIAVLEENNINRKRYGKQEAQGYRKYEKRPETVEITMATPEYIKYLLDTLAMAGMEKGDATLHFQRLLKAFPFQGIKRKQIRVKVK